MTALQYALLLPTRTLGNPESSIVARVLCPIPRTPLSGRLWHDDAAAPRRTGCLALILPAGTRSRLARYVGRQDTVQWRQQNRNRRPDRANKGNFGGFNQLPQPRSGQVSQRLLERGRGKSNLFPGKRDDQNPADAVRR